MRACLLRVLPLPVLALPTAARAAPVVWRAEL